MRGIIKRFAGTTVVDRVDLDLFAGQVHVLAGENGAGKSTLMKVLTGIHQPDQGSVEVDGELLTIDLRSARDAGIRIVHQELSLAPNLSVADNLAMGHEYRTRAGLLDGKQARARARRQLARIGARFSETVLAGHLSTGEQQLVEIARVLAEEPKVVIFDEPTAALSDRETSNFFEIVRDLRAEGTAIVYITHRMQEIELLADVITVLRDGKLVETIPASSATPEMIVSRMVGRPIEALFRGENGPVGDVVLEARGVTDGGSIGPIDLTVRAGEIVGLAGLIGAGRTEFARLLFGADRMASGQVVLDGRVLKIRSPKDAVEAGIAMVPESRKEQGLVLDQSIARNMLLASLSKVSVAGVVKQKAVNLLAEAQRVALGIRSVSLRQQVGQLSGGNQQKVLTAKWLETRPSLLILDEPTRGVDVGAKADIYRIIHKCAHDGMAILLISSDLPEVLGMASRIAVMREGRVVAQLDPNTHELTEEVVMAHAFGVDESVLAREAERSHSVRD
jgi:ribose transport system ATP-binding protein